MGTNDALKREAIAALEGGALLAFGVSEKQHGSDLLASDFTLTQLPDDRYRATGSKYYIGNSNVASIISVLAKKQGARATPHAHRAPFLLFALRPRECKATFVSRKIQTLGIRAAHVGEFSIKDHELPASDVVAQGRDAWDAVLGTVNLGKFFLGFGAIGICEHAMEEAIAHLSSRILYGKPVNEMPHIRALMTQAYARLIAMKLYAYRALDYVASASESDRRYLLYCAIQKAKVSTEGVKVMSLLSECINAKGFESDTYCEMALRDIQLFPGLESSTHINLALTAQFIPQYFSSNHATISSPVHISESNTLSAENPYLMRARSSGINTVHFAPYLAAYQPLIHIANVRLFARQAQRFASFLDSSQGQALSNGPTDVTIEIAKCAAIITYAQLIAERSLRIAPPLTAVIFAQLIADLTAAVLALASSSHIGFRGRLLLRRAMAIPQTAEPDLRDIAVQMTALR